MSKNKDRIRESNLRYRQSLGQNFLYDENLLAELTAEAGGYQGRRRAGDRPGLRKPDEAPV